MTATQEKGNKNACSLSEHGGPVVTCSFLLYRARHTQRRPCARACACARASGLRGEDFQAARVHTDLRQNDTYHLRLGCILSYLLVQSGRSNLYGASATYLANQHSKHRDHVANYGIRDTICATMHLFICSAARLRAQTLNTS